jgi:hypothetical protein
VYNEKPGSIDIKIKKSTENGVDRLSVKPTRFNKQCVDFLEKMMVFMRQNQKHGFLNFSKKKK